MSSFYHIILKTPRVIVRDLQLKTDKKDAIKLANYGLDHWLTLPRYVPEEDTRLMIKNCYRQYQQYSKVQTMLKNNLISLIKFLNFLLAFC